MHNFLYTDGIKKTEDIAQIIYKVRQVVKALRYKTCNTLSESSSVEQDMSDVSESNPYFDNERDDDESDEESDDDEQATNILSNEKSLKLDVVTRWYSQLFMLNSVNVRGRQEINVTLQK